MALHFGDACVGEANDSSMKSRKECSGCGRTKALIAFATFKDRHGVVRRRGICRACRDEYQTANFVRLKVWRRNYNKKNRDKKRMRDLERRAAAKAHVDAFKNRPCADCGRRFTSVAMDLDHVRGAKFKNVASLVGGAYRIELIVAELKKCDVVCACCHRIRTAKRNANRAPTAAQVPRRLTGGNGRQFARERTVLR